MGVQTGGAFSPQGFGHILLNLLIIILVYNNEWLWSHDNLEQIENILKH